ncbi:sulfotransferase family protein [Pontiella sulfatireligans]|uniref:Sulfotransferase family protein n=1 Tax=Pontiella sulfatireligans TaxID=2750658 RepID=A0A6C2UP05_9BACT|nr:sulfotransferase family protein [Pontiella sulfatireligans]VGO21001.1 hypothetical protein SCARR_03070 [Pontiella sulfatireligans]
MNTKVFCIGFHKTGTTSLGRALRILGYRVAGMFGVQNPDIAEQVMELAGPIVAEHDAFQDNPWPIIYKELDERYPGSKFVLTLRDPEAWLRSQVKHFGTRETCMRKWIYGAGCPEGNEEIYRARYKRHNEEVLDYFKDRTDDLLVMDLAEMDGWDKLCPFLGKNVPNKPFPHAGKSEKREGALAKLRKCFGRGK